MIKKIIKRIVALTKKKEIIAIPHITSCNELLKEKVAFILGGSGGIGFAIAKDFLESGCKVIIAGTNQKKISILISGLDDKFKTCVKEFVIDATDTSNLYSLVLKASSIFGKIDIFVNSAGTHTPNVNFWNISPDEYDRILNINLKSSFFICQAFAKYMKENNIKGHILLISSSRGSEPAWTPYGISKWGTIGMVKGLAKVLIPYGIVVNGIAPGPTATNLLGIKEGDSLYSTENSVGRLATPSEISAYARLMVSDLGNMIIGETLHISGGRGCCDIR